MSTSSAPPSPPLRRTNALVPAVRTLGFCILAALIRTALADEAETAERFGREYAEYRARTAMFIPWLV